MELMSGRRMSPPNKLSNIILRGYNSVPDEEQSVLPNLQSIILQGQGEDYIQGRLLTTALIPFHLVLGWKTWSLLQRMKAKSRWSLSRPNLKEFYLHGLPRFKSFTPNQKTWKIRTVRVLVRKTLPLVGISLRQSSLLSQQAVPAFLPSWLCLALTLAYLCELDWWFEFSFKRREASRHDV